MLPKYILPFHMAVKLNTVMSLNKFIWLACMVGTITLERISVISLSLQQRRPRKRRLYFASVFSKNIIMTSVERCLGLRLRRPSHEPQEGPDLKADKSTDCQLQNNLGWFQSAKSIVSHDLLQFQNKCQVNIQISRYSARILYSQSNTNL
jgi:hypothetical protein